MPFRNTLIYPSFFPFTAFICTVVISLAISASLMPDRFDADSPTCLLNIDSTS